MFGLENGELIGGLIALVVFGYVLYRVTRNKDGSNGPGGPNPPGGPGGPNPPQQEK